MKKICSLFIILIMSCFIMSGCSNYVAKTWGGTTSIKLEPNKKLMMITFKDNNLWILTRQKKANETSECYEFKEQSNIGILEGTVNICEQ